MSLFMAAMRRELREKGRIRGFGSFSSAAWTQEVREYEARLSASSAPALSTDAGDQSGCKATDAAQVAGASSRGEHDQ